MLRCEHLNNRYFPILINGRSIDSSQSTPEILIRRPLLGVTAVSTEKRGASSDKARVYRRDAGSSRINSLRPGKTTQVQRASNRDRVLFGGGSSNLKLRAITRVAPRSVAFKSLAATKVQPHLECGLFARVF